MKTRCRPGAGRGPILAALFLALALLVGQQAAALHDLAHATERIGQKNPGAPAHHACDQCFLSAQLAGAIGATIATLPAVVAGIEPGELRFTEAAPGAPRFAFLSRAPPALL